MLEQLADAIDEVEIPLDRAALIEAFRLRDRLDAKLSDAVGAFDAEQLWELDGATSMQAWLQHFVPLTARDAHWTVKIAKRLRQCSTTRQAWLDGRLAGGQVQVIVANLNDRRTAIYLDHEPALITAVTGASITDTVAVLRRFTEIADALDSNDRLADEPERWTSLSRTLDQRGELRGSFDPASATVIDTALREAQRADHDDETRTPRQRRADALIDLCAYYLQRHQQTSKRRNRPHVELITTLEDLNAGRAGETIDGVIIGGPDLATWACDSILRRLVVIDGHILDYGQAVRAVPLALFFAVRARDRHCRWPGCDRTARHCDAHHVVPWWQGGPTDSTNTALFCRRHHRRLHHPGWHAKLLPDATIEITDPTGHVTTSHPPRAGPTLFDP